MNELLLNSRFSAAVWVLTVTIASMPASAGLGEYFSNGGTTDVKYGANIQDVSVRGSIVRWTVYPSYYHDQKDVTRWGLYVCTSELRGGFPLQNLSTLYLESGDLVCGVDWTERYATTSAITPDDIKNVRYELIKLAGDKLKPVVDAEINFALKHAIAHAPQPYRVPTVPNADRTLPLVTDVSVSINGSIVGRPTATPGSNNVIAVSDRSNVWGVVEDSDYTTMFTPNITSVMLTE
ncbi:hypothetical protein EIS37_15645 [Salmonella enterica]|nr:hypothetical protein [Salmonella enterica]EBL2308270.1 hypothetical protein [Salmonella enterica]